MDNAVSNAVTCIAVDVFVHVPLRVEVVTETTMVAATLEATTSKERVPECETSCTVDLWMVVDKSVWCVAVDVIKIKGQ
jgi:hypothetical protein